MKTSVRNVKGKGRTVEKMCMLLCVTCKFYSDKIITPQACPRFTTVYSQLRMEVTLRTLLGIKNREVFLVLKFTFDARILKDWKRIMCAIYVDPAISFGDHNHACTLLCILLLVLAKSLQIPPFSLTVL